MSGRVLICAAVLLASCGGSNDPTPVIAHPRIIASFASQDEISSVYAFRVLAHHGIPADGLGSLGFSIHVDESQAEQAMELLNGVPELRHFVTPRSISDWPVREWEHDVLVDADIEEALETHDATTLPGRILRKAAKRRPESILARYPVVVRVKWRTRAFVHRDLTPTTAIEAVVLFAREKGGVRSRQYHVSLLPPPIDSSR